MTANDFSTQLTELTNNVHIALRNYIANTNHVSKHNGLKAIKVNVFDYEELTIVHDKLTFLDRYGYEYSIDTDCTLHDLIIILSQLECTTTDMQKSIIGFQVWDSKGNMHPDMDGSFCVYSFAQVNEMILNSDSDNDWGILNIHDGDIEEPTIMF
jgi:hypothetical protein